ncbi:MAG: hypothetical protein LBT00_09040 [Spirochaetaceae bacterium]|nr:hypothetical protein [Spirochaetaceae bacterium]
MRTRGNIVAVGEAIQRGNASHWIASPALTSGPLAMTEGSPATTGSTRHCEEAVT